MDGIFLNQTLDSFSCETDKLIGNIDMIDSPSEFFNFSDSFDKSMDSDDTHDSDTTMRNFMKELIDDFGKYFSDSEKTPDTSTTAKPNRKSCKYDDDFKQKVIHYINENCIKDAASKFSVHPNTIAVWMKENDFQKHLTEVHPLPLSHISTELPVIIFFRRLSLNLKPNTSKSTML